MLIPDCPYVVFRAKNKHIGALPTPQALLSVKIILDFILGEKMSQEGEQSSTGRCGEGTEEGSDSPSLWQMTTNFLKTVFLAHKMLVQLFLKEIQFTFKGFKSLK